MKSVKRKDSQSLINVPVNTILTPRNQLLADLEPPSSRDSSHTNMRRKSQATTSLTLQTKSVQNIDTKWSELKILGKNISRRCYHTASLFEQRSVEFIHYIFSFSLYPLSETLNFSMYVYGGYEPNLGFLSDFSRVMVIGAKNYAWISVQVNNQNASPGPRAQHQAIVNNEQLYIFGGQISSLINCNFMHYYDFVNDNWNELQFDKNNPLLPPPIDSHVSCPVKFDKKDCWIIFGGFSSKKGLGFLNQLFLFNLQQHKWEQIQPAHQSPIPRARTNATLVNINNKVYLFGGSMIDQRFNDLWTFDLETLLWTELIVGGDIPSSRNGHTMFNYRDHIFLLGGIHDITYEMNDFVVYSPSLNIWFEIDSDSSHQIDQMDMKNQNKEQTIQKSGFADFSKNPISRINNSDGIRTSSMRHVEIPKIKTPEIKNHPQTTTEIKLPPINQTQFFTNNINSNKNSHHTSLSTSRQTTSIMLNDAEEDNNQEFLSQRTILKTKFYSQPRIRVYQSIVDMEQSTLDEDIEDSGIQIQSQYVKMLQQKQKRQIEQKQFKLLQEFQMSEMEFKNRSPSPRTEHLQATIKNLGTLTQRSLQAKPANTHANQNENIITQAFKSPVGSDNSYSSQFDFTQTSIIGRRPCARDGHSVVLAEKYCYIFGGTRHLMSYNDLFRVDMDFIANQLLKEFIPKN